MLFGFIPSILDSDKAECLFCVVLSNDSMKPAKLKIHQNKKHPSTIEKEDIFFVEKKKTLLSTKQVTLPNFVSKQEGVLKQACRLSFEVALVGTKNVLPHTIAEKYFKPACELVLLKLCPNKLDELRQVPLSDNTMKRRIDEMAADVETQLITRLKNSSLAIQLGESTTVSNESLLLSTRMGTLHFKDAIHEDFFFSTNLLTTTTGADIFDALST